MSQCAATGECVEPISSAFWTLEMRASAGNISAARKYVAELVALAPDVILAVGGSQIGPLLEATHTVPIVFTITADPVGNGIVDSLARPGGNVTGFMSFEYSLSGKWQCTRSARNRASRSDVCALSKWRFDRGGERI